MVSNREVREMWNAGAGLNIIREFFFSKGVTGEPRDTETVMRGSEGGGWKSAGEGNSLAAYPTTSTVLD